MNVPRSAASTPIAATAASAMAGISRRPILSPPCSGVANDTVRREQNSRHDDRATAAVAAGSSSEPDARAEDDPLRLDGDVVLDVGHLGEDAAKTITSVDEVVGGEREEDAASENENRLVVRTAQVAAERDLATRVDHRAVHRECHFGGGLRQACAENHIRVDF